MLKQKKQVEPYSGVCCKSCYYAKGKRCTCKCEGRFHGNGLLSNHAKKIHEGVMEGKNGLDKFMLSGIREKRVLTE